MPPPSSGSQSFPVILIHGYFEDSSVWSVWESQLQDDGIPYCTVTFQNDDMCGTAAAHADELSQIVQRVKMLTHENQVNMVGHSKGGLDARVYLSSTQTPDVANLIMIGTPNAGDPLADETIRLHPELNPHQHNSQYCTPALFDLKTDAPDTKVGENTNTMYYTIYGNWNPFLACSYYGLDYGNYGQLDTPNDGVVPSWSVESLANYYANYVNLGATYHCHQDLTGYYEYGLSQNVLRGQ
jgi:triacylglycerol esterase/lipase EstA (alpha/beta hydrolase family)